MSDIVERLRAEWPDMKDAIDGANEIERLRAENEKLRAALKPFSKHDDFPSYFDDGMVLPVSASVGDLRAAAAALKETDNA